MRFQRIVSIDNYNILLRTSIIHFVNFVATLRVSEHYQKMYEKSLFSIVRCAIHYAEDNWTSILMHARRIYSLISRFAYKPTPFKIVIFIVMHVLADPTISYFLFCV